ncbi:MAG: hypothetical protein QNJ69_11150 [Gammaproteobacteria bacterium]|nr:hypothetical protein [Gammaproteobacteria bacterium]
MKHKILALLNALVCSLAIFIPSAALASAENILNDSGFETELKSAQGGWTLFDQSRFSSEHARNGRQSMFNWGFSRILPSPPFMLGTASGSFQQFAASPGSRWQLIGYAMTPDRLKGAPAYGIVQLSFFDDAGNDLGTVETAGTKIKARTSNQVNSETPAGEWVFLDTGIATAPANTSKVHAFTLYVDYSGKGQAQGVYFDDLKLCAHGADASADTACR